MAEATKEVETTETVTGVTLELTTEEAKTLAAIIGHIGGDPVKSPRRDVSAIEGALRRVGFPPADDDRKLEVKGGLFGPSMYFKNDDGTSAAAPGDLLKKVPEPVPYDPFACRRTYNY